MKNLILVLTLLFISIVEVKAQVPEDIAETLQDIMEIYQGDETIPGISAAVNIYNVGIWTGTSGESFDDVPLLDNMLMGIGSNTKTFTSALMFKLSEQDFVSLDDPINLWLPDYDYIDPNITIRQLLRHNSGIADFWTTSYVDAIFANPDSVWSPEDILGFVGPPLFDPGTNVSYSNTNFTLAGMIIEAAAGQEYHTLIRNSILTQLDLNHTYLEGFEVIDSVSAHPWHLGEDTYLVPRVAVTTGAFAAGCIKSTPEDMVIWFDQLFNQDFLSDDSFSEMTDFINLAGSNINGVGCGIFRMNYNSKTYYFHGGNIRGYSSYTLYDTEDKHSISIIRNDTFIDCESVALGLSDVLNVLVKSEDENIDNSVPHPVSRIQIFPNPFNPSTTISLSFSKEDIKECELLIYNSKGQLIRRYPIPNNKSSVVWDGTDQNDQSVSSGIYYSILRSKGISLGTRKMVLLK
jgi:D-alanyl-D-alanine carboxypeptidase